MSLCIVSCFVAFSGYYSSTAIIFLPINDSSVLLFITRFKRIPARDSGVIIIDTEKAIKRVLLIIIVESKRISRRCLEKTERIFIGQTKVTFPGISSVCALLHSLCPHPSRYRSFFFTAIEASYQYGNCALGIVRSVRFRVEKRDEQQQTTTTTTNNKQQQTSRVPSHPSFPRPVFHHIVLHPHHSLSPPITSMTVSILRYHTFLSSIRVTVRYNFPR